MTRRDFVALVAIATLRSQASTAGSPARQIVGILMPTSEMVASAWVQALQDGVREIGQPSDRDIEIKCRFSEGDNSRLPTLAEELVRLEPNIVVTASILSTRAVQQVTTAIPIVNPLLVEPVLMGFAVSEARPGGQVTGILASVESLPGKQLEIGLELIPSLTRVGFLFDASNPPLATVAQHVQAAAASLNITFIRSDVHGVDDLGVALQRLSREDVGLVFVPQSPFFFTERSRISAAAIAARLPTLYGFRERVMEGGLISYNIDIRENFWRTATFVDKILKGAKPRELPIELPTKLELVVNLKTARILGIAVPPALLTRADEVIE